ncbi:16S rRNA (uracil(1498)-N(3))-methyltransferase [Athalassotoga saccharophila]|uniref:16S rRNA (uracil(1498)-N(3))-methyltransferase n=1 Tax=Athalassotoga saccharophila TaxID=1441386 RepID=UPI00137B4ADC|nr:RsmE family RNA methyltransferase [Athalassotoga saccharophila]BBJ27904.1 ribosomal RNA small subunit methyltransferase E [Athalassotoga saccharophila]
MSEFFFARIENGIAEFDDHEINHMKVMRIKDGSEIFFTDGKGRLFRGILSNYRSKVDDVVKVQERKGLKIHIIISPIKWERMRFLVEKATELEISTLVLSNMDRTTRKETESKIKKIEFVMRDALKQSGNLYMPEIVDIKDFKIPQSAVKILFDPDSKKSIREIDDSSEYVLIFGPEGGFTQREKERFESIGFEKIKLSERILRVETAVIFALSSITVLKGVLR